MSSFALIRTNVKLTSNIQVVFSSDDKIYLESFDSDPSLSIDAFKKVLINPKTGYESLIPWFYKGYNRSYNNNMNQLLPVDTAFKVKFDNDEDVQGVNYSEQYDDIYIMGCSKVSDRSHDEEFECFAPLHIDKLNMPTNFIILRIDGSGNIDLDKNNFINEIVDKFKVINVFDLTPNTNQGDWLKISYSENNSVPITPFEINVNDGEFSKWYGIDYESGGFTSKSLFLKDEMEKERTFIEVDKIITDGYKENKIVYPYILNLKFLFNDTPATKTSLRKWSMNRYYGFYVDSLDLVKCVSPYSPIKLKSGFRINDDNIFTDIDGNFIDPLEIGYKSGIFFSVEYFGKFYGIKKIGNSFKIISPFKLSGMENFINKNIINIDSNNFISYNNEYNAEIFSIDNFDDADLWIIKMHNKYHIIKKDINGNYFIHTDYGFIINNNKFEYWINENDPNFKTTIDLNNIDGLNPPLSFFIYRVKFTDIKDFDTNIINTKFGGFEYEETDIITKTEEPKMYTVDLGNNGNPKPFNQYIYKDELVNIPASSEYVANGEIFEMHPINNSNAVFDLSDIWRKNPIFAKWGYQNSISSNDYPYRFNNSFYGEDFNKTVNPFISNPNRQERNLDYFYTINPDNNKYINHSLHITEVKDPDNGDYGYDENFRFEIDKYFNYGTVSNSCCCGETISGTYCNDYFDFIFSKKEYLDNGNVVRNTNKYSTFNRSDDNLSITNSTLFRGIKFNIFDVNKVTLNTDQFGDNIIDNISYGTTDKYKDWKFSIILHELDKDIDGVNFKTDPESTNINNQINWQILFNWYLEKEYNAFSEVVYQDIIYQSSAFSVFVNPVETPANSSVWTDGITYSTILWNPNTAYTDGDLVYRYGEFYEYSSIGIYDFWDPSVNYTAGNYVYHRGKVYKRNFISADVTGKEPDKNLSGNGTSFYTIALISPIPKWATINSWSQNIIYPINSVRITFDQPRNGSQYTYYGGNIWKTIVVNNQNKRPDISNEWSRFYSIEQDTDYVYGSTFNENNIILINNNFYLCKGNINNDTLHNGINIYINNEWKNILIHIFINDNTLIDEKGIDLHRNKNRDDLYNDASSKIVAKNFIDALNDMNNKSDFSDYINYYIIENDRTFTKYTLTDNTIKDIPVIILPEIPDSYDVFINSLEKSKVAINSNILHSNFKLKNNKINDISELNDYNGNPIGVKFKEVQFPNTYNSTSVSMYRFNGFYSPIFKEIDLFERSSKLCNSKSGNYKFDTELSNFGLVSEIIFTKINLDADVLKLKNFGIFDSEYPQLDEFGYNFTDNFIFKSTWDKKFYLSVSQR